MAQAPLALIPSGLLLSLRMLDGFASTVRTAPSPEERVPQRESLYGGLTTRAVGHSPVTVFTHVLPIWFARSVPRKGRATTERSRKASVLGSTITLRKQERNFCLRRDAPVFPRKPPLKSPRMKMGCQSCNPGWVSVSIL